MRTHPMAIYVIQQYEGFSAKPYLCPGDVWTIGYGHTKGVTADTPPITEEEADTLLKEDLQEAEDAVDRLVDVVLTHGMHGALVSFIFNLGAGKFESSTLRRKLNWADYKGAYDEFPRWVYADGKQLEGLKRRRASEQGLFNNFQISIAGLPWDQSHKKGGKKLTEYRDGL